MAKPKTLWDRIRQLFAGPPPAVDEEGQARLIAQLQHPDPARRSSAAQALAGFPTDVAGAALAEAVRDRDPKVRAAAADAIRAIAELARVPVTPVMDALQLEPADSPALFALVGALRALGPGEAAERVVAEKCGWGISRASTAKIDDMVALREQMAEFSPDAVRMQPAFDTIAARLGDPDPDVRADVRNSLAGNRYSVRPLWAIYNELLESEPRRAVLAGRVLGHRLNPRGASTVPLNTTITQLGIAIAFMACDCAWCGRKNPNVPVPQRALTLGCQGRRSAEGAAYALPVVCDFCGHEFQVCFEQDPR
ncbi:MAG: HEAT repeat domain-containing protein [Anaerolineae bacterium]|jgi:hypothetical protein|nr:hypothetical protein [Chloroflexota bacterium]